MIRAGRRHLVRTIADLAKASGLSVGTYRNRSLHKTQGHPPPISSTGSRVLLWDGDQIDAFHARGSYTDLPSQDSDDDLLDRNEAAALRSITSKSWDDYATNPQMQAVKQVVGGVAHWPRHAVRDFTRATGERAGRPTGAGDLVPRDEMPRRVEELLDGNPGITRDQVAEELGVHVLTAGRALIDARGRRIADILEAQPDLTPEQAARRLGYPGRVLRGAVQAATVEQRMRSAVPYLEKVCQALRDAGVPLQARAPTPQILDGDVCAASVVLSAGGPIRAAALVWDERWGWRTATSRLHPITRDHSVAPEGPGIRYVGEGTRPEPAELLDQLRDTRRGPKRPPAGG